MLSDCLKGLLPRGISEAFYDKYNITPEGVLENIFSNKSVHNWLSQYAVFLSEHLDDEYVNKLVRDEFKRFFVRNIYQYEYEKYSVNIVGDVACIFEETIRSVAQELGVEIGNIEVSSIGGLVKYHSHRYTYRYPDIPSYRKETVLRSYHISDLCSFSTYRY